MRLAGACKYAFHFWGRITKAHAFVTVHVPVPPALGHVSRVTVMDVVTLLVIGITK